MADALERRRPGGGPAAAAAPVRAGPVRRWTPTALARATVESVAENTSDAVVAPLFWGAVAGLPGLVGYRAVNTLDAMVGHRNARYARFGTAAARLDDVANLVPSRLTAVAHRRRRAGGRTGRPAGRCGPGCATATSIPSPNAGQCEAAMAGALGVRLGGRNVYFGRIEVRPGLGRRAGRRRPPDIRPGRPAVRRGRGVAAVRRSAAAYALTRPAAPGPPPLGPR